VRTHLITISSIVALGLVASVASADAQAQKKDSRKAEQSTDKMKNYGDCMRVGTERGIPPSMRSRWCTQHGYH